MRLVNLEISSTLFYCVMIVLEGEASSERSVKRPASHAVEEEVQL